MCQDTADALVHLLRWPGELQNYRRVGHTTRNAAGQCSHGPALLGSAIVGIAGVSGLASTAHTHCHCSEVLCVAATRCVDTPQKACKRCLTDFGPFVTAPSTAALTATQLPDAFREFCISSARREPGVCEAAKLGVASSFRGLAGRRAGAICALLSECNSTLVAGYRCARD